LIFNEILVNLIIMHLTRIISVLLLSFSIALAGFPAQAMPGAMKDCPMMKMQQEAAKQDMEKHDCCPKKAEKMAEKQQSQKQSPSGCCDNAACNVKCSASGMSLSAPSKGDLLQLTRQTQRLYPTDAALASHLLNTQDRPPKHLS